MKKLAFLFILLLPFMADAQVRIWQLSSRDKTNTVQPAGKVPMTDGVGSFEFGTIDTSKVAGLAQYIYNHTIQTAVDSVKLVGSVIQIFSGGSSTPTTVNLSTIIDNAGKIDSLKFQSNYLKVYQNGASVPDSVLIPTTDDQTAAGVSIADAGNYFFGSDVEEALQQIGQQIASGGDNWGIQSVVTGPGLSGNGTASSPLSASVISVNGQTGTVTITAPVTSVNGQTGTVTITAPVTSVNGQTGAVTITAPVTSVNGQTGTVVISTSDDQTASEVPITDTGNYFSGSDVESALQQLGASVASGGDNWGTQSVTVSTGLSGNGTPSSPLAVTISGNATHTGDVTGSTDLTIANNIIDYNRVATTLKGAITDNDGAWDFAASGIVNATISTAVTVSFTNLQVNKSLKIKLVVSTGGSITWPSGCVVLSGSATIAAGSTYYIFLDCWASDLVLVSITKSA